MAYRKIRHGLYTYHEPVDIITPEGKEESRLIERMVFAGSVVDVPRPYDLARGEQYGAFTEDRYTDDGQLLGEDGAPVSVANAALDPALNPSLADEEEEDVEVSELDDDELVEWLQATGVFDGEQKPAIPEVLSVADGDPELAGRLIKAEETANGDAKRTTLINGLEKIQGAEK